MTQSAIGNKDGLWTTVVAAAVFVDMKFTSESLINSQIQQVTAPEALNPLNNNHQTPGNNNKQ